MSFINETVNLLHLYECVLFKDFSNLNFPINNQILRSNQYIGMGSVPFFYAVFHCPTLTGHLIESGRPARSFITLLAAHPSPCPLCDASRLHVFSIQAKLSTDAAASLQFRRLFHVALKYSDCQTALGDEKRRLLAFSPTGPTSVARGSVTALKLSQMFEPFVVGGMTFYLQTTSWRFYVTGRTSSRQMCPTLIFT